MKILAILGSGQIAIEYSKILKSVGQKVHYGSSSSSKSKSWLKFKKLNPEVQFSSNNKILNNKKITHIMSCLPHFKQIKIFPKLMNSNKSIFIEKPFCLSSKIFKEIYEKNKKKNLNKYISFNRRYYNVLKKLKKRISKNDIKFVRVNICENFTNKTKEKNKKFKKYFPYFGSSSHILDLIIYLFGNIKIQENSTKKENVDFPSSYKVFTANKKKIFIFIEKDVPLKNGIEVAFKDETLWILSPIETLTVFKGYKITRSANKQKRYLKYKPIKIFQMNEKSRFKPGLEQTLMFFLKNKYYNNNCRNNYIYLKLYEKIFNFKN